MLRLSLPALLTILLVAPAAHAEPSIGTAIDYGVPVSDGISERLGLGLYTAFPIGDRSSYGFELSGSFGGYTGGWACGTMSAEPGAAVPSVAVFCAEPSLGLHALAGHNALLTRAVRLRLEAGAGATALFLLPGSGGENQTSLHPSISARAQLVFRLGSGLAGGEWWTGVQLQDRTIGIRAPESVLSLGWVLEAAVLD